MSPMRTLTKVLTATALVALAASAAGCARHYQLVGFPAHDDAPSFSATTDLLEADVARIEAAIDEAYPPTDAALWRERAAMRTLFDTQLALSNEHTDYYDPDQAVELPRPPVQRFPRLTAPAMVEPTPSPDGSSSVWVVPIVFSKETMYWSDSFEAQWLGWTPETRHFDVPSRHFSRWLVQFGDHAGEELRPINVDRYTMALPQLDVPLDGEFSYRLPNARDGSDALAVVIPTDEEVLPGYYAFRALPRIEVPPLWTPILEAMAASLREGDWFAAGTLMVAYRQNEPDVRDPTVRRDLGALADAIEGFEPTWFDDELDEIVTALDELAEPRRRRPVDPEVGLQAVGDAVRAMIESNPHPMPVYLDPPGESDQPFTFVVTGDFQYGGDMTPITRFLRMISTGHARRDPGVEDVPMDAELRARLDEVKFVVLAGDMADGEGLSSSPGRVVMHGLGALPPASPYEDEFAHMRVELARFDVPFFSIPGNHDAFVSFGGLLNDIAVVGSDVLKDYVPEPVGTLTHPVGEGLFWGAQRLPLLVKVGRMFEDPFFDGLVEYQHYLGPLNFAFRYRGQGFVGLNSANLTVHERDQVGALAENWGGSLYAADVLWFDLICRRFRRVSEDDARATGEFAFFHHDPRAMIPKVTEDGTEEVFIGYDHADALFNMLTFGYLGIEHSPNTPLFIPIISPIGSYLPRYLAQGEYFDQEWMGDGTLLDTNEGRADEIIDAINHNLRGGPNGDRGLGHLFFAHNDIPYVSTWVTPGTGGHVFPPPESGEWSGNKWGKKAPLAPFFKMRTVNTPQWGQEMRVDDGRDATVVRVDDVGQANQVHGFHLVTVDPSAPADDRVTIEWFEIPELRPIIDDEFIPPAEIR